ncbi:45584_t:CDS:2 [Gigaspora margarita]|uniref:45584_t:CDS:1 n=1 Tax=Gigaspora margarita TaxID=4874 RepID=A0ABN7VKJ7_GIGMA|nr:45584_t:CDS:2 [Gigaspora margarita]
MSRQTFLLSSKFDKTYIYKSPNAKYEKFSNAYAYSFMVKTKNPVPSQLIICNTITKEWREIKKLEDTGIDNIIKQHLTTPLKLQEYGSANKRRRKEAIKVRIVNYLHENLENNYGIYMARTTLNNYLLPCCSRTIIAKVYHHPAWVSVTGVLRDETKEHPNEHYCLVSVKGARQFAQTFSDISIIISQDDKSKIGLDVPAVGRTFCTLQSAHKPVQVPDYDFVYGSN